MTIAAKKMGWQVRWRGRRVVHCRASFKGLAWLALWIGVMLVGSTPCLSQVLNLGDPRAPAPGELSRGRDKAHELRDQAGALRSEAADDDTERTLKSAQAQWRDAAAWLLDQPDPLAQARVALLGWSLVQQGELLDRAIVELVRSESLSAEHRDDVLWNLRRFNAAALPTPISQDDSDAAALAQLRAAIRPLVEALSSGPGIPAPTSESLQDRLSSDGALIIDDPDLASLQHTLSRSVELASHGGWRVEAEMALREQLEFIENVRQLDEAGWLGTAWQRQRADAIAAKIKLTTEPGGAHADQLAQRIGVMARCVAQFNDLATLPPSTRPRLDSFREILTRWVAQSPSTASTLPWDLISEAFEAMAKRRADRAAPAQRELRMVCSALDDESDHLERMMAQWFGSEVSAEGRSEPEWVTVIGQHRANHRDEQMLLDLPSAIDLLDQYDPRASAILWKRLLPDARAVADPIVRETLLAETRTITAFMTQHGELSLESDWRSGADWVEPLVGNQRAGVLARLDALRRMRAAELTAGAPLRTTELELDAMRDLFRLVAIWRQLQSPSPNDAQDAACPLGLVMEESKRLEEALGRVLDRATPGGPAFAHAVESARQDAAGAVVVASLIRSGQGATPPSSLALAPLLAISGTCEWGSESGDVSRQRLAQWCVLQFEAAQGNRAVAPYLRFLSLRIADARWTPTD